MAEKHYISVILPLKLEWEPCYWTEEKISVGERVKVIFAGKEYIGVVSEVDIVPEIAPQKIKGVLSVEKDLGIVHIEEIRLWQRVADYYMCTTGEVYKAAYPTGKINLEQARAEARKKVCQRRERALAAIEAKIEKLQTRLARKEEQEAKTKDGTKLKSQLKEDIERIQTEISAGQEAVKAAQKALKAAQQGLILKVDSDLEDMISLSEAQTKAYNEVLDAFAEGKPTLLHGVTGAGKTEIYLKLAHECIACGKNVLYLVPEIALSRQLEERLYEHFGERLIVFHSAESAASRRNASEMIRHVSAETGNYIVLSTRSGIFLPHHNLGLIIVDEEHDSSYKQDFPAPRYNGRDTALILSQLHNGCNIILGSATPSLEELYNTSIGRHALVALKERYHGSSDSEIEIIDTKAERRKNGMAGNFSRKLIDRMRESLERGEQVLILRSRRAWAAALQCTSCGEIQKCPHCNVSLSYHKTTGCAVCHYCGYSTPYSGKCGKCGNPLTLLGAGTQKIEEEASALFPQARIARLDSDTAQDKGYETKTIKDFAKGEIDILIGTQIISKGFDFPNLSLVVIIAADTLLGMQDFRADEKAFQLMEQFRGRSGRRGRKGLFVIQTAQPDHPVYKQITSGDGNSMERLMQERKDFGFPPYSRIIELTIKDIHEGRLSRMAEILASRIGLQLTGQSDILSPVTGPYSPVVDKLADHHIRKIRICLKKDRMLSANKSALKTIVSKFEKEQKYEGHIVLDVDPA